MAANGTHRGWKLGGPGRTAAPADPALDAVHGLGRGMTVRGAED
ncbi:MULTISPECIES: hypothetical protein [unclassified Streptomyces]|nr:MULTISPECIES: hypothetical protein [unclassified Streptomyces]WAX76933.1 hypothetical protein HUV60_003910 [Streptomyces sp. KMM 9044]